LGRITFAKERLTRFEMDTTPTVQNIGIMLGLYSGQQIGLMNTVRIDIT
jgi:hypothetical protein